MASTLQPFGPLGIVLGLVSALTLPLPLAAAVAQGANAATASPRPPAAVGTATPSPDKKLPPTANAAELGEERTYRAYPRLSDDRCYGDPLHDAADLCAQWRAALAAEAAARNSGSANNLAKLSLAVGLAGLIALLWTLKLTRDSNRINRRIGEAQVRCYLSIERARAYICDGDNKPRLEIAIRNNGSSPSLETWWRASIEYAVAGTGGARRSPPLDVSGVSVALAPNTDFTGPATELNFELEPAECTSLLRPEGWLRLSVHIDVFAEDVFGNGVTVSDHFSGTIRDFDIWFNLQRTGIKPVQQIRRGSGLKA
jgi:hypothetical protein